MRYLLLLLLAVNLGAAPADVFSVRLHFENGNHWDGATTTILAAGDDAGIPSFGSWTLSASDSTNYFHISTNSIIRASNNHTVRGVHTNQTDSGTRGLAVTYNTPSVDHTATLNLGADYDELSGYVIVDQRIGDLLDGNTFAWDQILFENGAAYRVIQRMQGNPAGYRSHSSHASSVGNRIPAPVGRHVIPFSISRSALTLKFAVYNADTYAQISTNTSMPLDNFAVRTIKFSTDGHGGDLNVTNVWSTLVLVTNSSVFPLLPWPTNVYYVNKSTGSDSNTGRNSTNAWATIGKAASTCVSNDIVHVAAGSYDERVSEATAGVTYVADGVAWVRGFQITAPFVKVIGFSAWHTNNLGYAAFDISNASNVMVIDCVATNTSTYSVDFIPRSDFITLRGNHFSWPGYTNGVLLAASKIMNDGSDNQDGTTNVLIEYNHFMQTGDYINSSGANWIARNNRFGPTTTAYASGAPHEDGWQANARTYNSLMEANWHGPNLTTDSHFFLTQESAGAFASGHWTVIKNVSIDSGDDLLMEVDTMTNHLCAYNTFANVGASRGGAGPATDTIAYETGSTGNRLLGNIFTNAFSSNTQIAATNTGGMVVIGTNLTHTSTAGDIDGDPVFVDFANRDLRIQTGSPAKDVGPALCVTGGAGGTGTTITLTGYTNVYWFPDTFSGLIRGAKIYVGNDNNLEVVSRDVANSTITISSSITWAAGENVGYAYRGSGPDLGAYEFGDTLLTGAIIERSGSTWSVTPSGDCRFVVFYVDGVPQTPDYDSPYTYTITGNETVTAKAYAEHAQETMVFIAAETGAPPDAGTYFRNIGRSARVGGFVP